jgi:hypothetical protein
MIDAKLIRAIQVLALKAVEEPDDEAIYSRICRWYSREFSTPLPEVENLDPIHVLSHYFQDKYLTMSSGDEKAFAEYDDIKLSILFPEEYEHKKKSDDDWIRKLEEEVKAGESKQKQDIESIAKKMADGMVEAASEIVKMKAEELNLINDKFKLPDSGSIGED